MRRSGGAISKTNGGNHERETFSSPQVGIDLQSHQVKCRIGSASSPLNALLASEKSAEGNAVNRSGGNSAATAAATPA
ncbi:unnamed protein product, partial [Onchocerca flexuosa]|uniref:Transposase n=1 Tax=Onchocerca flexuosa TaxID=387005 RepID=A0A183HWG0_9BILA